jgi:hypothetical protein
VGKAERSERIFYWIFVLGCAALIFWPVVWQLRVHKVNYKTKSAHVNPLTEKELQGWYDGPNEKYFLNQLPAAKVKWGDLTAQNMMGFTIRWDEKNFLIVVDRETNPTYSTAEFTIAHEQCHVATWSEITSHGPKWQACMVRLAEQGAFAEIW